ncbi:F-box protein DOR-like [Silene latifolia]|uniref:F-box protein DOR-like n=1 Tax=Silene latifolia TaxID=37657 RepID=UPI003D7878E4
MSDASFEDIPSELQIEILSRLPPKPLSRCECVSKHWNDTLTIQAFFLKHSRSYDKYSKFAFMVYSTILAYNSVFSFELSDNNSPNTKSVTVPKTTKLDIRNNWMLNISTEEVIIGKHECFTNDLVRKRNMSNICNDLVCLFDYHSTHVGLLNLKTKDFIHLPALTSKNVGRITSWHALGFDLVNKVFKVLSIYDGSKECKAAILTLGSKHWKPVEYKLPGYAATSTKKRNTNNRFYLDGVIYWVNENNEIDGTSVLTVVSFDLNLEVFTYYMVDTIPIEDVNKIRYYLTSLKGYPTLFIWKTRSDVILQLTLLNHENPKAAWNRRSFIARDFPKDFDYGSLWTCVAGGSILLDSVQPIESLVEPQEQDKSRLSCYLWYDLEKFAVE